MEKMMDELFNQTSWHSFVESNRTKLGDEIRSFDGNRLLNTSEESLVQYFVEKYNFTIPKLREDEIVVDQKEVDIDVSKDPNRRFFDRSAPFYIKGTNLTFYIPFTGDEIFFKIQPSQHYMQIFRGKITNACVVYSVSGPELNPDAVKQQFERYLREISEYLTTQMRDSVGWNSGIEGIVRNQLLERKAKLLRDQNIVSVLGYKMRENPLAPKTYGAPEVKRKKIDLPPASTAPYKADPALLDGDYESILSILENMTHVMERSPKAFKDINEEALRMHFLMQLNGQYEGAATGETFNYSGKTDILIRSGGRNVFIAECKFWKGKSQYLETINQILGYASWRDTKVAILIFNRNKSITRVLDEIRSSTQEHSNYLSQKSQSNEGRFRYIFSQPSDTNRQMIITVMVFDVPCEASNE